MIIKRMRTGDKHIEFTQNSISQIRKSKLTETSLTLIGQTDFGRVWTN